MSLHLQVLTIPIFKVLSVWVATVSVITLSAHQSPGIDKSYSPPGLTENYNRQNSIAQYKAIINLNETLAPFQNLGCFIILTSFETVDIPWLDSPVMLRRLAPRYELSNYKYTNVTGWRWYPATSVVNGSKNVNCSRSHLYYFRKDDLLQEFPPCAAEIDIIRFASASKPWKCELEVNLFLSIHSFKGVDSIKNKSLKYPGVFEYVEGQPLTGTFYMLVESRQYIVHDDICRLISYGLRSRPNLYFNNLHRVPPKGFFLMLLNPSRLNSQEHKLISVKMYQDCNIITEGRLSELHDMIILLETRRLLFSQFKNGNFQQTSI